MLTRDDMKAIRMIADKAIRLGLATKHHRYAIESALKAMKEKQDSLDLHGLLASPSFADLIRKIRS